MPGKPIFFFTTETEQLARLYNLEPRDVVFARCLGGGADLGEAFYCIYNRGNSKIKTNEEFKLKGSEFLKLKPSIKILSQKLKTSSKLKDNLNEIPTNDQNNQNDNEDEKNNEVVKFTDKSYIIAQMVESLRFLKGKEKADVLMKIADLQRMKNDDLKVEEDKRVFYLPFVSSCRACKLMKLFVSLLDDLKP